MTTGLYASLAELYYRDTWRAQAPDGSCIHASPFWYSAAFTVLGVAIHIVSTVVLARRTRSIWSIAFHAALAFLGGVIIGEQYLAFRATIGTPNCVDIMKVCGFHCEPIAWYLDAGILLAFAAIVGASATLLSVVYWRYLGPQTDS